MIAENKSRGVKNSQLTIQFRKNGGLIAPLVSVSVDILDCLMPVYFPSRLKRPNASTACFGPVFERREVGFLRQQYLRQPRLPLTAWNGDDPFWLSWQYWRNDLDPNVVFKILAEHVLHQSTCSFEFFDPTGMSKPRSHRWGFDPPISNTQMMFIRML